MKQRYRQHTTVKAGSDEWVHVRRDPPPAADWTTWLGKAAVILAAVLFLLWLLKQILPWLILGAVGWVVLQFIKRR